MRWSGEACAGIALLLFAVATAFWPDWIETVSGVDPDGGNGWVENSIVVGVALAGGVLLTLARAKVGRRVAAGRQTDRTGRA